MANQRPDLSSIKYFFALREEVACGICQDHNKTPILLLSCYHYYCRQCLEFLRSRRERMQPLNCPGCETILFDMLGNDPDILRNAFFHINSKMIKRHASSMKKEAHWGLQTLCEMCYNPNFTIFCYHCHQNICDECMKSHHQIYSTDVVSVLDNLKFKQDRVKEFSAVDTPPLKCAFHNEVLKIFCFDCNQLICQGCAIFKHTAHKLANLKKAAPETRKKLAEHSHVKILLPDLNTAVDRVRGTKQDIQEGKPVEKQVNAKFQDILKLCKTRALKVFPDVSERKTEKLTLEGKGLDMPVRCVQRLVDFEECTLENVSDEELLIMQLEVLGIIDVQVVKRGKEAASADPVEEADVGVKVFVSEDLKKLCENN